MSRPSPPTLPPWFPTNVGVTSPVALAPATDNQLLIGAADGRVFCLNVLTNAVSLLEDLPIGGDNLAFVGAYGARRFVAWDYSELDTYVSFWDSDHAATTGDLDFTSSAWDQDLPEQKKMLEGFHIISDAPAGNVPPQGVQVSYETDESGVSTPTTLLNSANISTGDNFVQVSSSAAGTVSYRNLRIRIHATGGMQVYSVTALSRVLDFSEEWDVIVSLRSESADERMSDQQVDADVLRQYLWQVYRDQEVIEYQDGYVSTKTGHDAANPGGFESMDVTITDVNDIIDEAGEGKCVVSLRRVGMDGAIT